MSSKHSAHRLVLQRGIFDNLSDFSELEARISELDSNQERGDAFEVFAEAYLATQKIALAREVWPFEAIPIEQRRQLSLDTGRDMGVDGIYETTDGELRAYQVKFRSRRPALTWEELSTFMGLTDQVAQRVLFTNCDTLPALMKDRSGFVAIRGGDLDRLNVEDFAAMRDWLASGRLAVRRKQPMPHQDEALANIGNGLAEHDRATVVMACGTGKSLVALWAAEHSDSKTLLVLVPSLALVRQLLHEWLRETAWQDFSFLCVCSDPTVAKGADDLVVHQADLDFPVTTNSAVVRAYLGKPFAGTRLVFSTYQSAQVVAEGLPTDAEGKPQPFDLGVFDEAHKTASRDGTRFSFALEDRNLPIRKRLFFTATPRHHDVRKKDKKGDNSLVYSMDKPEIYGPVVHTLSFAEAARRGIICDYKVVISVVTSAMVDDHLLKHGEVVVDGNTVKARQVALQIALQKAVEKYGVSRIFSFHGSVKAARSFTAEDGEGIVQHLPEFTTLHVSGEMPTARREDQMKAFRQANKAVMSNARCLTEGVDVPAVDMVAFIAPRKSKVDIVQATGRAMRKSPGKEFGYVMVPLFVEQAANESIEDALKRSGFDDVWDLLGAMKEQDDVLVDIIRQMQEDKGRTGGYNESRFRERVEVLGPSVSLETIRESITAECLESLGGTWEQRYGELLAYREQYGTSNPPAKYRTIEDFCLGQWAAVQRRTKDSLSPDRRARLEALPDWKWEVLNDQWESGFELLRAYGQKYGHTAVPKDYVVDNGFRLGYWISTQRRTREQMPPNRRARIEQLPGWIWDSKEDAWDLGFTYLKEYADREGNCNVPRKFRTEHGYLLGAWLGNQRLRKEIIPIDRKERLESLAGWQWNEKDAAWEDWYLMLCDFVKQHGHSFVSAKYVANDGQKIGNWVANQRALESEMSQERKSKLERLPGWTWDVISELWEQGFRQLAAYMGREGHCLVPANFITEDGYRLGTWVQSQRYQREKLLSGQKERLESLAGWVWDAIAHKWEVGFGHLREFAESEGHCKVPKQYVSSDGYRVGQWRQVQRSTWSLLPSDRKERLRALPGWSDPAE
jgi:superfamily II DNA or RNA helicase